MQLVAYGAQDIYLTGNPQITFFKVVYRRHTNFSMESIEQTFSGQVDFGKKVTCTIARNGDLIYRVYLQVTLPAVTPTLDGCNGDVTARQLAGTFSLDSCGVPQRFYEGDQTDFNSLGETDEEGYTRAEGYVAKSAHFMWVNYIGHQLINNVEVEIGGQRIDKHYGDWLNIWNELTQEPGHQAGYDSMVGNTASLTGAFLRATEATTLYIPLQFWLNRLT